MSNLSVMETERCPQCSAVRMPGLEPCFQCGAAAGTVVYATWWQRVSAWLLDGLLVWVIALGTWFAVVWNRHADGGSWERAWGLNGEGDRFVGMLVVTIVGGWLLGLVWHVVWVGSSSNATPGHRIAGFRVLRQGTLEPVGAGRALLRELVKIATFVAGNGMKLIADAVLVGVMDRRQTLHDMAVGTACVRSTTPPR